MCKNKAAVLERDKDFLVSEVSFRRATLRMVPRQKSILVDPGHEVIGVNAAVPGRRLATRNEVGIHAPSSALCPAGNSAIRSNLKGKNNLKRVHKLMCTFSNSKANEKQKETTYSHNKTGSRVSKAF